MTALEADPAYQTDIALVTTLAPQWKADNALLIEAAQANAKAAEELEAEAENFKAAEQRYNTTKDSRVRANEAKEAALAAKWATEMQLGGCWSRLASKVKTHWYKRWVRQVALTLVPGITIEQVDAQRKLYESWNKINNPAVRDVMVSKGIKPTKGMLQLVKSPEFTLKVAAVVTEDKQRIEDRIGQMSDEEKKQMADNISQSYLSPEAKARISELAGAAHKAHKANVSATRSQAGAQGGAGNVKEEEPEGKPVVVVYTNSDRLRMCYLFIAEQHDWTEELVSLVFGSGLGETQEIVITPFKDAKFAAFESKQEQDALPEQRSEAS
jgi:hypothetical protein